MLEQWRDYRRRLAVHGAQREPRWFNASRLLVFWMGEEGIRQPTEHKRMALDIETWGDFLPLKEAGVDFFAGGFLARPELVNQRAAQPDMKLVQEILQLSLPRGVLLRPGGLPCWSRMPGCGAVAELCQRPRFDHASPIVSVTRALSYLGEQEIRKFVLIYGLARVSQHMPEACTRMAIARGRFCELIALNALGKRLPAGPFWWGWYWMARCSPSSSRPTAQGRETGTRVSRGAAVSSVPAGEEL